MNEPIRKILITGASGLVGKNISDTLAVAKYDLLLPSHQELDLLDFTSVSNYICSNRPDLIIHCAGKVGGIQANIREPVHFLIDNLEMGKNVIMAAYSNKIVNLMNMGSSCMYPRNAPNPLKEEMVLQGELEPTNEGYAIAKIAAQRLCSYVNKENPVYKYKTLIPCNLYGRFDKFDLSHAHMIPAAIHKTVLAQEHYTDVEIWGTGEVRREFMYAGDLAEFVRYSIENYERLPDLINVGTGIDYSINQYYATIAEVIGFQGKFIHDASKPEGMQQKLVDVSRATEFGWKAKTLLVDGIRQTYEYYLGVKDKK
jgi:GDP-L-fucose synthase